MADGYIELTSERLQTHEGMIELNRMLNTLFNLVAGDGENRRVFSGVGSPEGVVSAGIGSIYMRVDGAASSSMYVKESGTASTGWTAK